MNKIDFPYFWCLFICFSVRRCGPPFIVAQVVACVFNDGALATKCRLHPVQWAWYGSFLLDSPLFSGLLGTFWVPGPIWVTRLCLVVSSYNFWCPLGCRCGSFWGPWAPSCRPCVPFWVLLVASLGYLDTKMTQQISYIKQGFWCSWIGGQNGAKKGPEAVKKSRLDA